jgi:hypothetical protein
MERQAMPSKPTQRSLGHLKKEGWSTCVVEKWIPPRGAMKFGIRIDAFNFGDILACHPDKGIALIQTTDWTNISKHRDKILVEPRAWMWVRSGGLCLLWGWKKRPKDGVRGAVKTWELREEMFKERDFDGRQMERAWAAMQQKRR